MGGIERWFGGLFTQPLLYTGRLDYCTQSSILYHTHMLLIILKGIMLHPSSLITYTPDLCGAVLLGVDKSRRKDALRKWNINIVNPSSFNSISDTCKGSVCQTNPYSIHLYLGSSLWAATWSGVKTYLYSTLWICHMKWSQYITHYELPHEVESRHIYIALIELLV